MLHVLQPPPGTSLPAVLPSCVTLKRRLAFGLARALTERAAARLGSAPLATPPDERPLGPAQGVEPDQLMAGKTASQSGKATLMHRQC